MTEKEELEAIRTIIARYVRGKPFRDDTRLVSGGLLDSLVLVDLILDLESAFGTSLPASELQPDDFDSVHQIRETVLRFC